ncbi:serine hydrolase [Nocardioides sp. zg-579]|uniref:Serine hydrolase n=1 Tax=Nocardioides marmotae TaxID=2663857 RepID=A0A6I3J8K7_9ACTN|nr:serine hydrolase domain-containing protein [Nocardioides marmotae]MCR6031261.1 serine hydrolase [Gordonia jinghuaiqii]MTB94899.1 serine hydrolase [Nocardioides marmotae]QKE02586.1 beta-lactamase family protein [Nocardioides marmotae]
MRTLADVLAELHRSGREPGGAACLVRDGEIVDEAWAGTRDGTRPWTPDTLVLCYSVAKPLAALTVLSVVAEGLLELDEPVAAVWPEYAAHGKGATTVRQVLCHQAGQPAFPPAAAGLSPGDRAALVALLADTAPEHEPGTAVAEHALTYGHLCDEIVRRATGETLADRFARIVAPHGWDLHLAVHPAGLDRVADVVPMDPSWPAAHLEDPAWGPVLGRPPGLLDPAVVNSPAWRTSSFPAVSLHASAQGLALLQADLADPGGAVGTLLGPALHAALTTGQATGHDRVLGRDVTWTLGYQRDLLPAPTRVEVGMGGLGGCAGWTSLTGGYGAAYVSRGLGDADRSDLVDAVALDRARRGWNRF